MHVSSVLTPGQLTHCVIIKLSSKKTRSELRVAVKDKSLVLACVMQLQLSAAAGTLA